MTKKNIMITRPAHQAGHLADSIHSAGGEVFLFPTLEIIATEASDDGNNILQNINQFDIIIFISPNAVEHGLNLIQTNANLSSNTLLATIGEGSAKALQNKLGKQPDITPKINFNSEGLLATTALQQIEHKRILIVRGNGGREHLKETLQQRGAKVEYLSAYQRIKPAVDCKKLEQYLQNNQIAAIVITSGESLKNLTELTPKNVLAALQKVPLILINDRLIDIAKQEGFTSELNIANEASDGAILEVLKNKYLS
jgi:uroporphyrinogen-III synthase